MKKLCAVLASVLSISAFGGIVYDVDLKKALDALKREVVTTKTVESCVSNAVVNIVTVEFIESLGFTKAPSAEVDPVVLSNQVSRAVSKEIVKAFTPLEPVAKVTEVTEVTRMEEVVDALNTVVKAIKELQSENKQK